ncbi:uncharacterized protein METZ01_LOCUS509285, partial [marine metagenome]
HWIQYPCHFILQLPLYCMLSQILIHRRKHY